MNVSCREERDAKFPKLFYVIFEWLLGVQMVTIN
jgi:hypothetical protein